MSSAPMRTSFESRHFNPRSSTSLLKLAIPSSIGLPFRSSAKNSIQPSHRSHNWPEHGGHKNCTGMALRGHTSSSAGEPDILDKELLGGCLGTGDIHTLQIGNDWFSERTAASIRVYSELMVHLPDAGVQVCGLVAGSAEVEMVTGGAVRAFASPSAPLWLRLLQARRAVIDALRTRRVDLLVSHFALYAFPVIDRLQKLPVVIHFHGPWAAESGAEGSSRATSRIQAGIERAVYYSRQTSDCFVQGLSSELGAMVPDSGRAHSSYSWWRRCRGAPIIGRPGARHGRVSTGRSIGRLCSPSGGRKSAWDSRI